MIPSVIAYARLMGLPAEQGLYAALLPLLIYPFFGTSRETVVGPDMAISLLIVGAIGPLANGDGGRAAALAAMLALMSGGFLLLGAAAKIGAVADFLSKPVLIGYMTGAALILMASQLGGLLGLKLTNNDFFPRLAEVAGKLPQVHEPTLIFGLALLALLIVLRYFVPKIPIAITGCVVAMVASRVLGLEARGVAVVGQFRGGLPAFAIPTMTWHDVTTLLPAAIGITLLAYTEGILLARAFAAKNGYEVRPNQELIALGMANLGAGLFRGFSVTGTQSRTVINDAAGAKSQMANLVAAVSLVIFLLFLTPLLAHLPTVALAAVLIYGASTLVEFGEIKRLYRYYPEAAVLAAITTLAVLAAGVVLGILFGVVLSLLGLIKRISHPPDAVLREIPGHGFHDVGEPATGETLPGLISYRFYAPLLFCNCGHFTARVRSLILHCQDPVRWFLLDAQAITDIDVTAVEALHALNQELAAKGIALKIAHANPPFRDLLARTGLAKEINQGSFFASVHECVEAFQREFKVTPRAPIPPP